jgi:hypothetical protein
MINEDVERIIATEQFPLDTNLNMPRGTADERGRTEEGNSGSVIGAIKDKAQNVASTVADKAAGAWEATRDTTRQWAGTAADKAGQAWDTTRTEAQHLASVTADRAEDAFEWSTSCMRRHPYAMLLTMFGVGFLMGQTFRRMA